MANRRVMGRSSLGTPALLLLLACFLVAEARMFPMGMSSIMFPQIFGSQGEGRPSSGGSRGHISAFRFSHRSDSSGNTTETSFVQHDAERNSTVVEDCLKTVDSPDILCVETSNGNMTVSAYEETALEAEEGEVERSGDEEAAEGEESGTRMSFEKSNPDSNGNLISESVTIVLPGKQK